MAPDTQPHEGTDPPPSAVFESHQYVGWVLVQPHSCTRTQPNPTPLHLHQLRMHVRSYVRSYARQVVQSNVPHPTDGSASPECSRLHRLRASIMQSSLRESIFSIIDRYHSTLSHCFQYRYSPQPQMLLSFNGDAYQAPSIPCARHKSYTAPSVAHPRTLRQRTTSAPSHRRASAHTVLPHDANAAPPSRHHTTHHNTATYCTPQAAAATWEPNWLCTATNSTEPQRSRRQRRNTSAAAATKTMRKE